MRYCAAMKFLALLLTACALLVAVAGGVGVTVLTAEGLYNRDLGEYLLDQTSWICDNAASLVASRYASATLGHCPEALLDSYFSDDRYYPYSVSHSPWYYTLELDGELLASNYDNQPGLTARQFFMDRCLYISLAESSLVAPEEAGAETTLPASRREDAEATTPSHWSTEPPDPQAREAVDTGHYYYYDSDRDVYVNCLLEYYYCPTYAVTLYLDQDSFLPTYYPLLHQVYQARYAMIAMLVLGLLGFAGGLVYLCCAAGRSPAGGEPRPGGLNRLPLDLYAGLCLLGAGLLGNLVYFLAREAWDTMETGIPNWGMVVLGSLGAYGACLLLTALPFALAAQGKYGKGFWWRHSVMGWSLLALGRGLKWVWSRGIWPFFRGIGRLVRKTIRLLPLTWQWLLAGLGMELALFLGSFYRPLLPIPRPVFLLAALGILLYGANAFGVLFRAVKRMRQGQLEEKVDRRFLLGCFGDFADNLNSLGDVTQEIARRQMRSERMKAELITNVSHDIKTPLTSIINYVDLLQKAASPEEAEQYLEVLQRQSQRMKKLIEDLIEMSKASTGNLPVDIGKVDAVEAVNQALGEFADKLTAAGLTPVFRAPEGPVWMKADGRLAWRVLSNLLSNAVKYSLGDTRLYVDLVALDNQVLISLKNISREQLQVDPGELLERFVRGDASRNTEGSGLGLNIAKSLMELQGGQLQLLVDGDLFKVTLLFPAA